MTNLQGIGPAFGNPVGAGDACYRQGGELVAPLTQLFFSAVVRVVFRAI